MSDEDIKYEAFVKEMHEKYPKIFSQPYGGFCIGAGWYQIIRSLCHNIQAHIDAVECARINLAKNNPRSRPMPEEVPQVVVSQIKEKFGGLRFYYDGGDDMVEGMVHMAESWAANACETCGKPAKSRNGGWIRTLCDEHEEEQQNRIKELDGEE